MFQCIDLAQQHILIELSLVDLLVHLLHSGQPLLDLSHLAGNHNLLMGMFFYHSDESE